MDKTFNQRSKIKLVGKTLNQKSLLEMLPKAHSKKHTKTSLRCILNLLFRKDYLFPSGHQKYMAIHDAQYFYL